MKLLRFDSTFTNNDHECAIDYVKIKIPTEQSFPMNLLLFILIVIMRNETIFLVSRL